jgi:hypothetical protein
MAFHVDPEKLPAVLRSLDETIAELTTHDGFKGLLCLEMGGGARQRITIVSLWEQGGLEATSEAIQVVREHVAATIDLGVTVQTHEVLRLQSGPGDSFPPGATPTSG